MEKRGDWSDPNNKKDSSHIFSHEVQKAILNKKVGRPFHTDAAHVANQQLLGSATNLRIKTRDGNLKVDRPQDKKIIKAIETGETVTDKETIRRAERQLESLTIAAENPQLRQIANASILRIEGVLP